jgi:protein O-mannosyl-transferase
MAALLVLVAVLAVYLQSLGGPFLWDDRMLILDAPLIEKGGSLGDFLNTPFWAGGASHARVTSYYRPLVSLSLALDDAVHGGNSGGYHLTNVVLHAANALLLYFLVRRHGTRAPAAALVAVGWALLPRLAEAAAWISGRTDLLASLFTLAALLVIGPTWIRRIVSALFIGLGLFAKESAAAGILAIAAGIWAGSAAIPTRKRLSGLLAGLAPFALALVFYAALRVNAVGFASTPDSLGAVGRIRTVLEAVGTYAAMLVDVWRPRAVIGRIGAPTLAGTAAGVAVLVLLVALLRFRSRLTPTSATGVALCLGALLPVLHIVPIPLLTLAADRFLYLPTAGLALALAPSVERFVGARRARWAAALVVVASLAVVTFQRVGVWSDEIAFWVQTYRETPKTNKAAATELAGVYYRAGLYHDAWILAARSYRYDDPRRTNAAYNVGLCLVRLGRYDEARAWLVPLRGEGHKAAEVELQLALLEVRAGRFDAARTILKPLVSAGGVPRLLWNKLANLERARQTLDRLDASSPAPLRAQLATFLDDDSAVQAWNEVLEMPGVPKHVASEALDFLAQRGDRAALVRASKAYRSRFGAMEPRLEAMIEVRLTELDRLIAARSLVDLSVPEKT